MDNKKQQLLIEYLISSPDTFALCQNIVNPTYFDPEFRNSVAFIKQYYDEYNTTPNTKQLLAETSQQFETYTILPDEAKYCALELEKFCKQQAMKHAILASPDLIKDGKYGEVELLVKEALLVSLNKSLGLRYYDTIEERLKRMLEEDPTSPTGWTAMDSALFGGISRKELLLVSANSGGGKSITLANLAHNFVGNNLNVLYISLELSEDIVAQRCDTMHTGIGRKDWKDNIEKITKQVSASASHNGILDIIQMPSGTSSNDIRAYLKEFYLHYNMYPDLLILDYLDNMSPNEQVSADNVFEKDKRSSEQLRQIAVDYNMFAATASQLNRQAIGAVDHDHSQIAGGISKIHVADVYWSIVMTEEMRAAGKIIFHLQKTRNSDGVGKQIFLKWDATRLRIVDEDDGSGGLIFKKRSPAASLIDEEVPVANTLGSLLPPSL